MSKSTHILVPVEVWDSCGMLYDLIDENSVFELDLSEENIKRLASARFPDNEPSSVPFTLKEVYEQALLDLLNVKL